MIATYVDKDGNVVKCDLPCYDSAIKWHISTMAINGFELVSIEPIIIEDE